ncbi:MAG: glycosyltransferase family 4 protein [Elusimicrobiota bacterium]
MIKVLHIITKLEFGGAQGNTIYTVSHLDKTIFDAKLVAGPGGMLDEKVPPESVTYAPRLTRSINPANDLLTLFNLRDIIREEKPFIVHTHSSKAGILGRLAARLAGVPVIVHTFHGFGFHERQNVFKKYFFIFLEKFCALFTDALIFVSSANMDYARHYSIGSEARYSLIRSGIPLKNYPSRADRAAKRRELGVPQNATLIVSLGNLKPQKNPGDFIAAALRLSGEHKDAVFMLVGGGEDLETARTRAKEAGLEHRLLFPGWREDSAEILAAADIFALTSLWEGLPRSLVEAIKTGLPSVCYRTDGVADLLYDGANGYMVEQGDMFTFCSRIKELIENPALRAEMSAKAAGADLSEFDIDYMVRQQEKLYCELLKKKESNQ